MFFQDHSRANRESGRISPARPAMAGLLGRYPPTVAYRLCSRPGNGDHAKSARSDSAAPQLMRRGLSKRNLRTGEMRLNFRVASLDRYARSLFSRIFGGPTLTGRLQRLLLDSGVGGSISVHTRSPLSQCSVLVTPFCGSTNLVSTERAFTAVAKADRSSSCLSRRVKLRITFLLRFAGASGESTAVSLPLSDERPRHSEWLAQRSQTVAQ